MVTHAANSNILGSTVVPLDLVGLTNGNYVTCYVESSYRLAMIFSRENDTKFSVKIDGRAGFNGYGNIYGMK